MVGAKALDRGENTLSPHSSLKQGLSEGGRGFSGPGKWFVLFWTHPSSWP